MKNTVMRNGVLKMRGAKGFTLVEVIIVLVILVILIAIAIPALKGYLDKARDRAAEAEAKAALTAAQSYVTEKGIRGPVNSSFYFNDEGLTTPTLTMLNNEVAYLVGDPTINDSDKSKSYIQATHVMHNGRIGRFEFTASNGRTVLYTYVYGIWKPTITKSA
jgi:prepilin-type N-terminal cleavage/methylation domain-containing protein